jgi:hypothetical protein
VRLDRSAQLVVGSVMLMIGGALVIKACGDNATSDPIASVHNGAPRGLLALKLLLDADAIPVNVRMRARDPLPGGPLTMVVAPPETSAFTDAEVQEIMQRVRAGDHLIILCDDAEGPRNHRLLPLLDTIGAECQRADVPLGDEKATRAQGTMPGYGANLFVRGDGRVKAKEGAPVFPAWTSGSDELVDKRAFGDGLVTVIGSATILANDGLAQGDNAAFALAEIGSGRTVVFDERHHGSSSRAAFAAAAVHGTGPITALIATVLLLVLSLLSLAPRPGDPPRSDDDLVSGAPAAEAQARALASLLLQARAKPRRKR